MLSAGAPPSPVALPTSRICSVETNVPSWGEAIDSDGEKPLRASLLEFVLR
jgi:hypothetical protein